jgi:hypothetical protein
MNPKASFENLFRSKLRGIVQLANSVAPIVTFRLFASELEFHNKMGFAR